jgi:hypothetical protein
VSLKAFKTTLSIPLKLPLAFINQPKTLVANDVYRKIKINYVIRGTQGGVTDYMRLLAYYAVSTGKQLLVALREILEDLNLQYRLSY